ncbi:hypothetical protein CCP1ISM_10051 [Azospirillaceae bacterium]
MHHDLTLCGWRVHSDWPLPELLPWHGSDRPVDVWIRRGEVPESLPGIRSGDPLLQVNGEGLARFAIPGVAAYLIREGREITIATRLPDHAPDVGLFLFGTVFGVLCHQRGVLPLHASCVAFGERAFAFAGVSGSGKSTLAAALVARGGGVGRRRRHRDRASAGVRAGGAARPPAPEAVARHPGCAGDCPGTAVAQHRGSGKIRMSPLRTLPFHPGSAGLHPAPDARGVGRGSVRDRPEGAAGVYGG